jgi:hypothetical protein
MKVSFVETMRGSLRGDDGRERPFDFTIRAEADGLRALLRTGVARVRGLVRAAPWAAEAPAEGTLELAPIRRRIAYDLSFRGDDGALLSIRGHKSPSLRDPLRSMTWLPVGLFDGDRRLASGEARFDLADLGPFLASWLPVAGDEGRRLDARRRQLERRLRFGETTAC